MWTIFKVFIEFVTLLLLFYAFCVCGHKTCGILASWPGIRPATPALEGQVVTTGLPQEEEDLRSPSQWFLLKSFC